MKINFHNLKIIKDFINRKNFIKTELIAYLKKIIIQNQNSPTNAKIIFIRKYKYRTKYSISKQINRCLDTSKAGSVFKLTNYSRHVTKKKLSCGLLQNVKTQNY